MNKSWLKVLCITWLVAVTPLFGIFPLWCILCGAGNSALCGIERAFLREVWDLFFPDPEPGFDDVGPPLTTTQWWTMISIALMGALAALYCCYKWWTATRRQRMNVIE